MNDLITAATSGLFVEVGKVIEHMKAQASRIADLERQLAEASAPAVVQQPIGYLRQSEIDKMADHRVAGVGMMLHKEPGEGKIAVYSAPLAADTDKVREALPVDLSALTRYGHGEMYIGDDCDFGPRADGGFYSVQEVTELVAFMAAQAPVREVPEGPRKAMEQMHHALSVAEGYMDAVCFNTTNPKKRNNYAGGLRIIRDAMSAYEALSLPAAPVQQEGA